MQSYILHLGIIQIVFCRQIRIHSDHKHHIFQRQIHLVIITVKKVILHAADIRSKFLFLHIIDQIIPHGLCLHENSLCIKLLAFHRIRLIGIPHPILFIPVTEIGVFTPKLICILQITLIVLRTPLIAFL